MDKISNSSTTTQNSNITKNNSCIARLRRLKIQGNVLSVNLMNSYRNVVECNINIKYDSDSDVKKKLISLRDSYNEIKNLYEDVKAKTNFNEDLERFDMIELKTDILQLESKIKTLKEFLRNELTVLQANEETLLDTVKENGKIDVKNFGNKKNQAKRYNEFVPSPVRAIINTPFKCSEVHQYHNFLKNSINRYGGWNEYNHNTFVNIWNKYYKEVTIESSSIKNLPRFEEFKDEILQNIPGTNSEGIISHSEWYHQYMFLKIQQQNAINKWQENKRKIKKREIKTQKNSAADSTPLTAKLCRRSFKDLNKTRSTDSSQKLTSDGLRMDEPNKTQFYLLQPTKQWINRCQNNKEISEINFNVETISKLGTPLWRLSLQ